MAFTGPWLRLTSRCEAVEKRAKKIHGSYVNKINKLDEKFNKVKERQARPAVLEIRDEEGNITTHAREAVSYRAPGVARRCASHLQGFGRTQDVRTCDRMRERRQDQLSYENQNPNTYGEHLVEGH